MANRGNQAQGWEGGVIDGLRVEQDRDNHHDQQDAEEQAAEHATTSVGLEIQHVAAHDDAHGNAAHHGNTYVVKGRDPPIRQRGDHIILRELEGSSDIRWGLR